MWAGNESSRLAAVQALVERGTFAIDDVPFKTVDKVQIGGRFYSDKPLLLTCWLAAVYWCLHTAFSLDFQNSYHLAIYLVTLLGVSSFSVLLAALFLRQTQRVTDSLALRSVASLGVVLTTWIFSYGATVNNHTPAACVLFALFCTLEAFAQKPSVRTAVSAGLLAGTLFNLELAIGGLFLLGGAAALAVSTSDRKRVLAAYLAASGALLVPMLALDYVAYGSVLPAYLVPGAFDFPGNIHSAGYAGLRRPTNVAEYLWAITFGARGLFLYMPALLFAAPTLWKSLRARSATAAVVGGAVTASLAYYGTQTGDYGGWAYGFRFLIPVIPLLFWYSALWLFEHRRTRLAWAYGAALGVGLVTSSVGVYNPWPASYEGASTPRGSIEEKARSTFLANVLCLSFEQNPDSRLTRLLLEDVYGEEVGRAYLELAFNNMKRPDLSREARGSFPGAK
jgi:hypothetical protein